MKAYISEAIGTCLLTLVLILVTGTNPWVATIFAVFTLMFIAYGLGHISGAHVNPALTIGALVTGRMPALKAVYYLIAQIAGAAAAVLIVKYVGSAQVAAQGPTVFSWKLFGAETMGMFIFSFGVAAVAFKRVERAAAGFVVGLSLFAGIIVSSLVLNGTTLSATLNPAVAYGLSSMGWASILGPILGAIIGTWAFVLLSEDARHAWKNMTMAFSPSAHIHHGPHGEAHMHHGPHHPHHDHDHKHPTPSTHLHTPGGHIA